MSVAEYFDNLAKHGRTYKAGDASSLEALEVRWEVMVAAIDKHFVGNCAPPSIFEVGCGYGGFPDYLEKERPYTVKYTGIDISPHQARLARDVGHRVSTSNVLDVNARDWTYDYVVGQGLFYKQVSHTACHEILTKMWDLATKAVVITTILDGQENELSFTITQLLHWVYATGCTKWTLRHDYHPNDVCLYLYKERHGTQRRLGGVYHV